MKHLDFRFVLRDASRARHDRLDRMISVLDLGDAEDFARFADVHAACFGALGASDGASRATRRLLSEMIARLSDDLLTLKARPPSARPATPANLDPLAIDYVVEGSRLGSQVLKRRWETSTDPAVRAADRYFGLPADPLGWRATCAALSCLRVDGRRAARVTRDVDALFDLFADACRAALPGARGRDVGRPSNVQ
ncbi:MAG: biliverdin-producing heme oxygenase [Pseudomonadota bacterium]